MLYLDISLPQSYIKYFKEQRIIEIIYFCKPCKCLEIRKEYVKEYKMRLQIKNEKKNNEIRIAPLTTPKGWKD